MARAKKSTETKKVESKKAIAATKKVSLPKFNISKIKNSNYKPFVKIIGMILLIVGSFAVVDLGVQYLNNDYSVAVVDGVRISKAKWHDTLEQAYGSVAAQELIEDQILKMEARKSKISVSKDDINAKIDEIRQSVGGEEMLQSALKANKISMPELRERVELDILYTKILTPLIEYTDDDIKNFFNQYSEDIFTTEAAALEEGEKLDFEKYKEKTTEVYIQNQIQTKRSSWLAEKKKEYKIQDNSTAKPKYGFLTTTTNIIMNVVDMLKKEK